jgi:hypothetical protein
MLNNTPSYPALLAAKQAHLVAFKDPKASPAAKKTAETAYRAAFVKCVREAGIWGRYK